MPAQVRHMRDARGRALQGRQSGQDRVSHRIGGHDELEHDRSLLVAVESVRLLDIEGETHIASGEGFHSSEAGSKDVGNGNRFGHRHSEYPPSPDGSRVVRQYRRILANHEPHDCLPSIADGFGAVNWCLPPVARAVAGAIFAVSEAAQ